VTSPLNDPDFDDLGGFSDDRSSEVNLSALWDRRPRHAQPEPQRNLR
jgi:hypothetical protein